MKKNNVMIVLSDEVKAVAKKNSALFGGNLSAYLAHLILSADKEKTVSAPTIQELTGGNAVIGDGKIRAKTRIKK